MGQQSRRKSEGREPKDPLRWVRANVEARKQKMDQLAMMYHQAKNSYDSTVADLERRERALALAATAAEVAPAAEAPGGLLVTRTADDFVDGPVVAADEDVVTRDELGHGDA